MPSLKDLRVRISSVKSTQKITSAMKMVAASKLRRAQEAAESARPYAEMMESMMRSLAASVADNETAPALLRGTGKDDVHLLIVATSDRGLCGGFNSSIVRAVRRRIAELQGAGKTVKLFTVNRKGRDQLRREYGSMIVDRREGVGARRVEFGDAVGIVDRVTEMYEAGEFDVATIVYNRFKSVISQEVTFQQLVPFAAGADDEAAGHGGAIYEFEPDETEILDELLPRNLGVQVFRALLENAASEQGARMTAMDNATRNAGDMIDALSLQYNRTRQAVITKELIEIISGADAL
jgi:F-type H+-transporting ATPase subunit gamma